MFCFLRESYKDLGVLYIRESEKWEEIYDSWCTKNSSLEKVNKQEALLSHYYLKQGTRRQHNSVWREKVPDILTSFISPKSGITMIHTFCQSHTQFSSLISHFFPCFNLIKSFRLFFFFLCKICPCGIKEIKSREQKGERVPKSWDKA